MADFSSLNGYNVKDAEARASIETLAQNITGQNLLINSDFRTNVINQRGASGYQANAGESKYTIDRWCLENTNTSGNATVNIGANHVTVSNNSNSTVYFKQEFEQELFEEYYTITVDVHGLTGTVMLTTGVAQFIVDGQNVSRVTLTKGKNTFVCYGRPSRVRFEIAKSSSFTLGYVKLECGTVSTPLVPRNYGEELLLCQRYYYILPYSQFVASIDGSCVLYIHNDWVLNNMRSTKKVTKYLFDEIFIYQGSQKRRTVSGVGFGYGAITINLADGKDFSPGVAYMYPVDGSAKLMIEAEV